MADGRALVWAVTAAFVGLAACTSQPDSVRESPERQRRPAARPFQSDLLVSLSDRLLVLPTRARVPAGSGQLFLALDDLGGGLVFQYFASPRSVGGTSVMWLPAGASEPEIIIPARPGEWLELHQVEEIGGSPTVILTRWREPQGGGELVPEIRLHDLATGRDRVAFSLEDDARLGRVSYARGRFLLSTGGGFELRSVDGSLIRHAALPRPSRTADHGVLSPDASLIAYVVWDGPHAVSTGRLAVFDVARGEEVARAKVSRPGLLVRRVEFDGKHVLISREDTRDLGGVGREFLPLLGSIDAGPGLGLEEVMLPARADRLPQPLVASFVRSELQVAEGARLSPRAGR